MVRGFLLDESNRRYVRLQKQEMLSNPIYKLIGHARFDEDLSSHQVLNSLEFLSFNLVDSESTFSLTSFFLFLSNYLLIVVFSFFIFICLFSLGLKASKNSINIKVGLVNNSISSYDFIGFSSCFLITFVFYLFSAFASDDSYEMASLVIFIIVFGSILGYLVGFLGSKSNYGLSPSSVGEQLKRLAFMDIVNFSLCFIRVITC